MNAPAIAVDTITPNDVNGALQQQPTAAAAVSSGLPEGVNDEQAKRSQDIWNAVKEESYEGR